MKEFILYYGKKSGWPVVESSGKLFNEELLECNVPVKGHYPGVGEGVSWVLKGLANDVYVEDNCIIIN